MTCAKAVVICVLDCPDGSVFVGENWCNNPQETCPREPGEDYTKCKTICQQPNHAEIDVLNKAGIKALGATAMLKGNTYFCRDCQEALFDAGVAFLSIDNAK